ncbi:MAG: hypothetical protein WKI04_04320, partial [Ferruginibacter sp.]
MNTAADILKRPLAMDDLQQVAVLSAVSISADGRYLAYVTTKVVWKENTHRDLITVIELSTGKEISAWEGTAPKWAPVLNEVAFLASYADENYIWLYSLENNIKKPLAPIYESHYFMGHLVEKNFAWSPNGLQIAYVSTQAINATETIPGDIKVIERLLYKTKGGRGRPLIADDQLSHIWVVPVQGGVSQLVTDSEFNEHSICWSPDSTRIAFVSNR